MQRLKVLRLCSLIHPPEVLARQVKRIVGTSEQVFLFDELPIVYVYLHLHPSLDYRCRVLPQRNPREFLQALQHVRFHHG